MKWLPCALMLCVFSLNLWDAELSFAQTQEACEQESILKAVEKKEKRELDQQLSEYINRNAYNLRGVDLNCVKVLLAAGADPDSQKTTYGTPFVLALGNRGTPNLELVKLLVDAGADLTSEEASRRIQPYLGQSSQIEVFKYLLDRGLRFDPQKEGPEYLVNAVYFSSKDLVKFLVEEKKVSVNAKTKSDKTPASQALELGSRGFNVLKYLASKGADLKATNSRGETLLHLAVRDSSFTLARYLLDQGLDPNEKTKEGFTPLYYVSVYNHLKPAQVLVERGADPLIKAKNNSTLAHQAAQSVNLDALKFYLSKGVDPKSVDDDGRNLFHALAQSSNYEQAHVEIAKFLLDKGVDFKVPNKKGQTPLSLAAKSGNVLLVEFLLSKGADPNASGTEEDGGTPLHRAASYGNLKVVKLLVEAGAKEGAKDKSGKTPYEIARSQRSENSEVEQYLRPYGENGRRKELSEKWTTWAAQKSAGKVSPEETESLIEGLRVLTEDKKNPPEPPKDAPNAIKNYYDGLKGAKQAPWTLTEKALDIELADSDYFQMILKAARTREAAAANKFHPTPEQAKRVLQILMEDRSAVVRDYEGLAWLIAKSGVEIDLDLLRYFNFKKTDLKKDVAEMLATEAYKYRGFPLLAAIKLAKAFLSYPKSDFACSEDGGLMNSEISSILIWFAAYGDNPESDRGFFAKLARLMLESKPVCPADRNILLRAMNVWRSSNPPVQLEIACAIGNTLKDTKPFEEKNFSDVLLLSQSVGMRTDFSPSTWVEQIKAFSQVRKGRRDSPLTESDQEIYRGILKPILGNPEGKLEFKPVGERKIVLAIGKTSPQKGKILQLCRIRQSAPEIGEFLAFLKGQLGQQRPWPKNFVLADASTQSATIQQEFEKAGFSGDLEALQNDCAGVQQPAAKAAEAPKPQAAPKPKSKPRRTGDFHP